MTHKTGNFKKFSVFINMLSTALTQGSGGGSGSEQKQQKSHSVIIDLLTKADLEMLKARKTGRPVATLPSVQRNTTKRYVILTYIVEFDRVHYPLPLKYEATPDPAALQNTIRRLRRELEDSRSQQMLQSKVETDTRRKKKEEEETHAACTVELELLTHTHTHTTLLRIILACIL
jgi:coiled-coil domain-containing protein 61